MRALSSVAVAACLLLSGATFANTTSNIAYGLTLGTNGVGLQGTMKFGQQLNLRLATDYFSYSRSVSTSDVSYRGKMQLQTVSLLADWHPWPNPFRLTAGLIWNGDEISAKAKTENGFLNIGGQTFTVPTGASMKASSSWRTFAPYAGIGWGAPVGSSTGLRLSIDLGVKFAGSPSTRLRASDSLLAQPGFADAMAQEQSRLRKKLDASYIPVVLFGAHYAF